VLKSLPNAVRFAPPANDWCSTPDDELPALLSPADNVQVKVLVSAGELLDLEPPEITSWFENGLLPVGGQLILHGWAKSFKSFLALDIAAALAQAQDWCGFEPTEEPCRVAVMQYEIPWPYYQQRIRLLRNVAREGELFDTNFLTFTPLQRPRFVAGNTAQEDMVLATLESAGVQVFLLDPVRRATGVADLNSEKEVRPLLAFFERLQNAGITVITCHHDNKSFARSGGGNPLGMTGVGAFAGDADTIVSVSVPKGGTIDDRTRNLHFTFRNAPSLGARGMEMQEDGHILYSPDPHGNWDGEDEAEPAI
jgi:RecA-family ATPase